VKQSQGRSHEASQNWGSAQSRHIGARGWDMAARVILECEARGYQAFWNTSEQNVASIALARRLGFQTERPFRVLAWSSLA
jgi:hypothetical protein